MSVAACLTPPPLAGALRLRTDDPEAANAHFRPQLGPLVRVLPAGAAFAFDFQRLAGQRLEAGVAQVAVAQTLRGVPDRPILHLQAPPGSVYRHGRRDRPPSGEGTLTLLPPGWRVTRRSGPGTVVALQARPGALEAELDRQRPGEGGHWLLGLAQGEAGADERAAWHEALAALAAAIGDAAAVERAEQVLLQRWAALALRLGAAQRLGGPGLDRLSALERWIAGHLAEPITLERLCEQAGVGPRCLQQAFARARGVSPMRYVTECRLLAAWQRLHRGEPGIGVTEVALELGFDHLGRFARLYRDDLGETPSRTLAQARRRAAATLPTPPAGALA